MTPTVVYTNNIASIYHLKPPDFLKTFHLNPCFQYKSVKHFIVGRGGLGDWGEGEGKGGIGGAAIPPFPPF